MNKIFFDELIDESVSEAINLHGFAAGPMQQRFFQFRGAGLRETPSNGLPFLTKHLSATHWAVGGHLERMAVGRLFYNTYNLRNHIPTAFKQHAVIDLDAQTFDFVFIVKSRVANGCAAELNGFQNRHWRESPGASNLDANIHQLRRRLSRPEFHRECPPRRL